MRGSVRCVLLIVCSAAVAGGCGSSSTSTTRTQAGGAPTTAAAIAGHELSRLNGALPIDAARLPAPSPKPVVESKFLTALFDDAQTLWRREFAAAGLSYKPSHLVVYWSNIESVCGRADDSGPFFCPGDRTVYLDLRFFTLLEHGFGVQEVAQAYIVGHEVAHNVQNLLGIAHRVDVANQADPNHRNSRSVRVELEADCLAGVWGRSAYARAGITSRDLQEAVKTAEAIGDDYGAEAAGVGARRIALDARVVQTARVLAADGVPQRQTRRLRQIRPGISGVHFACTTRWLWRSSGAARVGACDRV